MKDGRVERRIGAENVPWNPGQISPVCTTCVYITLGIGVCVHVLCVDFNCINFSVSRVMILSWVLALESVCWTSTRN